MRLSAAAYGTLMRCHPSFHHIVCPSQLIPDIRVPDVEIEKGKEKKLKLFSLSLSPAVSKSSKKKKFPSSSCPLKANPGCNDDFF